MTKAEFITRIRFLFSDLVDSNYVRSESLTIRPENIVDGVNLVFYLANRRISQFDKFMDHLGNTVPSTEYAVASDGEVVFTVAPKIPYRSSYYWQKLTDAEIESAINMAKSAGKFNPDSASESELDYAVLYCLAYCYLSASSKAAEYYTISGSGKQVSKSELFNHYMSMYQTTLTQAKEMRTDQKTDRGSRDEPSAEEATCAWVAPVLIDSGGG